MTTITYVYGDVTETSHPLILHGCNAQGRMMSGVARQIREKFPLAWDVYWKEYNATGLELGTVISVSTNGKTIANGITQQYYGTDGKRYISYDALVQVLETVDKFTEFKTVSMPRIGAGLGGGAWPIIAAIIETSLVRLKPYVYQPYPGTVPNWR